MNTRQGNSVTDHTWKLCLWCAFIPLGCFVVAGILVAGTQALLPQLNSLAYGGTAVLTVLGVLSMCKGIVDSAPEETKAAHPLPRHSRENRA